MSAKLYDRPKRPGGDKRGNSLDPLPEFTGERASIEPPVVPVESGYSIPYPTSWSEREGMEALERGAALIDRLARRIEDQTEGTA